MSVKQRVCVFYILYGIYSIQFSPVVLKPLAHCMALFNATLMSFLPSFPVSIYARRSTFNMNVDGFYYHYLSLICVIAERRTPSNVPE